MAEMIQLSERKAPLNIALGILFDTASKKILIVKRKKPSHITGLTWCFPGTKINYGDDIERELKKKIREKTGLAIEILGSVFVKTYSEENGLLSVYYLCEIAGGKKKLGEEYKESKWISPDKIEKYFGVSLHPNLKEYLIGLK